MVISIITPFFNEEDQIPNYFIKFSEFILTQNKNYSFRFVVIDDGSTDNTLKLLLEYKKKLAFPVKILEFSKNYGQEAALYAGILNSVGDYHVIIDCDFQDPIELISEMLQIKDKYDMVIPRREKRDDNNLTKTFFANFFYFVQNLVSYIKIPSNTGYFRIINNGSLERLKNNKDFLNGKLLKIPLNSPKFSSTYLSFNRVPRKFGYTKFSFIKLLMLGFSYIYQTSIIHFLIQFLILVSIFFTLSNNNYLPFLLTSILLIEQLFYSLIFTRKRNLFKIIRVYN